MMDNVAMYRALSSDGKKAVHPFTTPLMYDDPTCKELGVHEVYDAIHFLEEQFHQPFYWVTFIQHFENSYQFIREESERWDIYAKTNYGALIPVCIRKGLFGGLCGAFRAFPCICKITRPALCAFGSGSIAMNGANLLSANRQLAGKGDVDKFSGMLGVDEFFNFQ